MKKKLIQVMQVMHAEKENTWTVVFIMTKKEIGLVVQMDEVDARNFIHEFDMKETKDRSGSVWQ